MTQQIWFKSSPFSILSALIYFAGFCVLFSSYGCGKGDAEDPADRVRRIIDLDRSVESNLNHFMKDRVVPQAKDEKPAQLAAIEKPTVAPLENKVVEISKPPTTTVPNFIPVPPKPEEDKDYKPVAPVEDEEVTIKRMAAALTREEVDKAVAAKDLDKIRYWLNTIPPDQFPKTYKYVQAAREKLK